MDGGADVAGFPAPADVDFAQGGATEVASLGPGDSPH